MHTTLFTNCCGHLSNCVDIVVYHRNSTTRMLLRESLANKELEGKRLISFSYACIDRLAIQSKFSKCRLSDIHIILAICYINFRRFKAERCNI